MQRDELAGWLRLTLSPGVGNQAARKLLAAFGLPEQVFAQSLQSLQQVVSAGLAQSLHTEPPGLAALVDSTIAWLQDQDPPARGHKRIVALGDPLYPAPLLTLPDPPLVLYLQGAAAWLAEPDAADPQGMDTLRDGLAIVGSRNPTPQGLDNARQFARSLAGSGLCIVSGLALGIDGAAHEGALEGWQHDPQALATIAVVGTGLDRVYPRRHLELARRIATRGLLLSEYPIGTPPLAPNFPKRNRLIAALARGTLVVEATLGSGSLITARETVEQGREVFAIPGSIHAPQSRGCHALIKQGAKLVESAQDVLEELGWGIAAAGSPAGPQAMPSTASAEAADDPLMAALGYDPVGLDALQARTGLDTARLQAQLMALELAGQVARLPGGLFQRMANA